MTRHALFFAVCAIAHCAAGAAFADNAPGVRLYERACAACHASDGRGRSRNQVGFETPLPDFSDCAFASREPDADWFAVIHDGGPVRAFDRMMPAFADALRNATAGLDVILLRREGDDLLLDLQIANLAGHKLPTAYPSRRTWLHVAVRDPDGAILFESGALRQDGSIAGNDNDDNGTRHEPHHVEIATPEDVQIYESVIVDARGRVTTGLLHAARYVKDNRLLPHGFDKAAASDATAVHGRAAGDSDFIGGGDTVRYRVPLGPDTRAASISARLLFQTVAFRWAESLARYDSTETTRFVRYYREQASRSAVVLAGVETEWIQR